MSSGGVGGGDWRGGRRRGGWEGGGNRGKGARLRYAWPTVRVKVATLLSSDTADQKCGSCAGAPCRGGDQYVLRTGGEEGRPECGGEALAGGEADLPRRLADEGVLDERVVERRRAAFGNADEVEAGQAADLRQGGAGGLGKGRGQRGRHGGRGKRPRLALHVVPARGGGDAVRGVSVNLSERRLRPGGEGEGTAVRPERNVSSPRPATLGQSAALPAAALASSYMAAKPSCASVYSESSSSVCQGKERRDSRWSCSAAGSGGKGLSAQSGQETEADTLIAEPQRLGRAPHLCTPTGRGAEALLGTKTNGAWFSRTCAVN